MKFSNNVVERQEQARAALEHLPEDEAIRVIGDWMRERWFRREPLLHELQVLDPEILDPEIGWDEL